MENPKILQISYWLKVVKCCICLQKHAVNEAISQMFCKFVQEEKYFLFFLDCLFVIRED